MAKDSAIKPKRHEDYPNWYQSVVKEADLAEMAHVRGCMVIKPWGFGIWEKIQRRLDKRIRETGHQNVYFPIFIPLTYIEKEAQHVEGFAKEMAVVTHHRLEVKDGKLVPTAELETPLIVRPTSETIIGESMSQWIQSYRDLPLLINQWANVVRWELRPRVFLRTTEFLWQEGHTAHATAEEAAAETHKMLEVYRSTVEDWLALPVIAGEKPASERFPGAERTFSIEAMMQDLKALQAGTSHDLGQNFARSANIKYLAESGEQQFVYTTSWGVSTRLVGGVIMTHGDDNGLRLPPRIAPHQIVVVPILRGDDSDMVTQFCRELVERLNEMTFADGALPIEAHLDDRLYRSVEKKWGWIKKGVPLLLEVGPRDVKGDNVTFLNRAKSPRDYETMPRATFLERAGELLDEIQSTYFREAKERLEANTRRDITTPEAFFEVFSKPADAKGEDSYTRFVHGKWCEDATCEEQLKPYKVTIRCLPFEQSGEEGTCVLCGKPAMVEAIFARAY